MRQMSGREVEPLARARERYETRPRRADERRSEVNERVRGELAKLLGTPVDEHYSIQRDPGWIVRPSTTCSGGARGGAG